MAASASFEVALERMIDATPGLAARTPARAVGDIDGMPSQLRALHERVDGMALDVVHPPSEICLWPLGALEVENGWLFADFLLGSHHYRVTPSGQVLLHENGEVLAEHLHDFLDAMSEDPKRILAGL